MNIINIILNNISLIKKNMIYASEITCHRARPVKGQNQKPMSAFPALVLVMVPICRSALALFRLLFLHRLLTLEKHDQAQVTS